MEIYLVRHGESLGNRDKFFATRETPLTDKGIQQAREAKTRLGDIEFDLVVSSAYQRAIETTKEIREEFMIDERAIEHISGLEGLTLLEARERYPWGKDDFTKDPLNHKIEGYESRLDVYNRAVDFIESLDKSLERVLIVSHENFISSVLAYVFDNPKFVFNFKIDNAKISAIGIDNGRRYMICLNV